MESMSGFAEAIRLEEQLSEETRQWERQKRILDNEIAVLATELAENRRRIESIQADRSEARERREALLARAAEERTVSDALLHLVEALSTPANSFFELLPRWSENWNEAPELISTETPPVEFLRLLQQIQSENQQTNSRAFEVEDPESGETYRVDLLTFGLGAAYFSSEDGAFGGQIVFDGGDWSPEIIPDYSLQIRNAIDQESGQAEPHHIVLPVSVNPGR